MSGMVFSHAPDEVDFRNAPGGDPVPRFARLLALICAFAVPAAAQPSLIPQLKAGGYVLVMRHAHSPTTPPAPPDAANRTGERQLDAEGLKQAEAIGRGLKAAGVPVGAVWSSPTFRAKQTVQGMGLKAESRPELGDGGASMATSAAGQAGTAWLKAKATEVPAKGTDVVIVTHGPNITLAFGDGLKNLGDGEAAVFKPDGQGGSVLVGRIKPGDWPS
jgi:phosphohistidine phosphatase SixA